jgi:hypothetical protein
VKARTAWHRFVFGCREKLQGCASTSAQYACGAARAQLPRQRAAVAPHARAPGASARVAARRRGRTRLIARHHVVAGLDGGDALAHALHNARGLVAQHAGEEALGVEPCSPRRRRFRHSHNALQATASSAPRSAWRRPPASRVGAPPMRLPDEVRALRAGGNSRAASSPRARRVVARAQRTVQRVRVRVAQRRVRDLCEARERTP